MSDTHDHESDDDVLDVIFDGENFDEDDDFDDWDDDDEFLDELDLLRDRAIIDNLVLRATDKQKDFDYDYDRDDYPYGYGVD